MLCPKCRGRMETIKCLPMIGAELRQRRCTRGGCGFLMITTEGPGPGPLRGSPAKRIPSPEMLFRLLNAQRNREWRQKRKPLPPPPPP